MFNKRRLLTLERILNLRKYRLNVAVSGKLSVIRNSMDRLIKDNEDMLRSSIETREWSTFKGLEYLEASYCKRKINEKILKNLNEDYKKLFSEVLTYYQDKKRIEVLLGKVKRKLG